MSDHKPIPTLSAGFRIKGTNTGTVKSSGNNTVTVSEGQNVDAHAGLDFEGEQKGEMDINDTNLTQCVGQGKDVRTVRTTGSTALNEPQVRPSKATELGFQIKGHVTIFNQEFKRDGSLYDVESLKQTFQRFGINPTVKLNSKYKDIDKEIKLLSRTDFSTYKLFVCIFMSHGHSNGRVRVLDKGFNVKPTIIDPIMKNKSLNGILKIFIIVACPGSAKYENCDFCFKQKGMDEDIDGLNDGRFLGAGGKAPYIISYSTLEGLVSYRVDKSGTYFIQALCDKINKANGDTNMTSIFVDVNHELATNNIQVPVFESSTGSIYFKDLAS